MFTLKYLRGHYIPENVGHTRDARRIFDFDYFKIMATSIRNKTNP